jgi:hypothetical protein
MSKTEQKLGLFIIRYEVGGDMPGAPLFRINFSVYTPAETVSGIGHITSGSTNPPLDIATNLHGQYTYMTVMPKISHILITATGYPVIKWPSGGGIGPVILPNVDLRMVVTEDWASGTANYKYMDGAGNWHEITNAPVKVVQTDMSEEKAVTLYLSGWQKRMVMDYVEGVKQDITKIQISKISDGGVIVAYMAPPPPPTGTAKGAWNLYLTDEHINQVAEMMGIKTKISALNITPEMLESKAVVFE